MEKENTQQEREAAAALAEDLGNLPLALEQAAAYATRAGLSLADYLGLFRARRPEVEARSTGSEEYPTALATTFNISFTRLRAESPAAAELLTLCAFLAPDEVPLEILKDGAEHLPPALAAAAADPEALAALAATLQTYALAKVRGGSFLTLHHFVQAAARDLLSDEDQKKWAETSMRLMDSAFPFQSTNLETWPTSARLLQHALITSERAGELPASGDVAWKLLNRVGEYLLNKAELEEAKVALERALEISQATFGSNHPNAATCINNLGRILQELGDVEGARANYERALAIDEAAYGPDHTAVAVHLNNIGTILEDQGDLEGARANFERALIIDEAGYGPDHPEVATGLTNLGLVLLHLGNLADARANCERALMIDEKTYGLDHPEVATDLNNLGVVLEAQGDYDGARASYERAERILNEFLGENHPLTLHARKNLERLKGLCRAGARPDGCRSPGGGVTAEGTRRESRGRVNDVLKSVGV